MSERRRSARIEASDVRRIVDAVRRGDIKSIKTRRWPLEWSAEAHETVSDAFATHLPPGMLSALRRTRLRIGVPAKDGTRAPPSHSCLATPMPDHVIEEDVLRPDTDRYGPVCPLSAVACAIHAGNYGRALEIMRRWPAFVRHCRAIDACKRGDCEGFRKFFVEPFLSTWRHPYPPEPGLFVCLHGAASYTHLRSTALLSPTGAMESFFNPRAADWPTAPAAEQAEVLVRAYRDGVNWYRVRPDQLRRCFQPDTQKICRVRFRAPIVEAVAAHLPVEGVPELVASYVPCPLDAFF